LNLYSSSEIDAPTDILKPLYFDAVENYAGFNKIQTFELPSGEKGHLIEIKYLGRGGGYSSSRYIACFDYPYSDKIEKFIPPKKGSSHILRIIRELVDFKADNTGTDIGGALKYLTNAIKKRCTAFLISDFMCDNYTDALKIASNKHDLMAIRVSDERESNLPNVGMVQLKDAESGEIIWVDTSSKEVRNYFANRAKHFTNKVQDIVKKSGVDLAEISTGEDYVIPLMKMFKKREGRL